MSVRAFAALLREVRGCELCSEHLPEGPRPVVQGHPAARVLIIGQAPGRRVHASGVPWNDPSGERLRGWLGVDRDTFYDPSRFALVPMGFCYPGTGSSGDLPPRPECAPEWHARLLAGLPNVRLTLLLSRYAIDRYLPDRKRSSVTEVVRSWREHRPRIVPLPHPSPRNLRWFRRNPWFEEEVLPYLAGRVRRVLRAP